MSNIKNVVHYSLTPDNHSTWRAQVIKVFQANGFHGFLDGSASAPTKYIIGSDQSSSVNPDFTLWQLIDQNLKAALYSVISPPLLPYVLNLDHTHSVWVTIDKRLQSTNRSRILQLKNELHHLTMKDMTMTQYLSLVKSKVDAINAAGSSIDTEDIILYTLNGLPGNYNAFKTSIRINLQPLSLEICTPCCAVRRSI
ncbi:Retrovirus-related Pol polyprotein from transposon TNT 1-94 [Dendrobium catenatum]|uniref:Retrovirus-related Pol polyprotein from transposon TNT 1-94 n=1 Tax=Dendrobium catenatum TaxID=906689 RepID=A0A2I0VBU1_9ASPA|nr:Retrovirus-related Pol polyprotein from transposon TNT 1-94 [Dendrobium catenatum]